MSADRSNRVELSLNVNYLKDWGLWEGVREIVQNAVDAQTQHGAIMRIEHERLGVSGVLHVENDGAELTREMLLFGTTTKEDDDRTIGHFGEGLKLGALALVRAGHVVKIRSGDETWTPTIERSDKFDAQVLVVHARKTGGRKNRVHVEIGGVSRETWNELRSRFLFVDPPPDDQVVTTSAGAMLLEPRRRGMVFVKGVFVCHDKELAHGYDLPHAETDRDRRIVRKWDLEWATSRIVADAAAFAPDLLADTAYDLASAGMADVARLDGLQGFGSFADRAAARFVRDNGADAVPVTSDEERADIAALGRRGVVVGRHLAAVLRKPLGDVTALKDSLRREVVEEHEPALLPEDAAANLRWALDKVLAARVFDRSTVRVATFRSGVLDSQPRDGNIYVAWRLLGDRVALLGALVREIGGNAVHELWLDVVREMSR